MAPLLAVASREGGGTGVSRSLPVLALASTPYLMRAARARLMEFSEEGGPLEEARRDLQRAEAHYVKVMEAVHSHIQQAKPAVLVTAGVNRASLLGEYLATPLAPVVCLDEGYGLEVPWLRQRVEKEKELDGAIMQMDKLRIRESSLLERLERAEKAGSKKEASGFQREVEGLRAQQRKLAGGLTGMIAQQHLDLEKPALREDRDHYRFRRLQEALGALEEMGRPLLVFECRALGLHGEDANFPKWLGRESIRLEVLYHECEG